MQINCCSNGRIMLQYLEKRDVFILQPPKEKWWMVIDYCPYCGVELRKGLRDTTEEMEPF